MAIGSRIKTVRGSLSRDKFAPQTGISKTTLVNYETGERNPPSDYLIKILELFPEISPAWLLTGEGVMKRPVRLSDSEAHQALKERLNSLIRSPSHVTEFGMSFDTYRAYLYGDYLPTKEELAVLGKIAGGWTFEAGTMSIRNQGIEGGLKRGGGEQSNKIIETIDENILHDVLKGISEALKEACRDENLETTIYTLEDLTELIAFCYDASINDGDTTSNDYKKIRVKRLVALLNKGYQSREHTKVTKTDGK